MGAAAISPQIAQISQQHLGADANYNVYAAEVAGLQLAAKMAHSSPTSFTKCVIYVDSQAAIKGLNKPSKQSGQEFLISTITEIQALIDKHGMTMEATWVPGHKDVDVNEKADKAAREAAKSKSSQPIQATTQRPLKSARTAGIRCETINDWNESWRSQDPSCDAMQLCRITQKSNIACGKKLYNLIELTRRQTAKLACLRSGHCALNQYLHRFDHAESPQCDCNNGAIESVEHFLLHCPWFEKERTELSRQVGVCGMRMEKLLGHPQDDQTYLEICGCNKMLLFLNSVRCITSTESFIDAKYR